MTFREKLAKEKGRNVQIECPFDFGYEEKRDCSNMRCTECWDREIPTEKTYEEGLQDAWELAKKIATEFSTSERADIFGYVVNGITVTDILKGFTPQEALAKLKAYEEEKEIKVGDVVHCEEADTTGVVVKKYHDNNCYILFGDGSAGLHEMKKFKQTGKHIDIADLLGQIRGE